MRTSILILLFLTAALNSNAQYDHSNINLLGVFDDTAVVAENFYGIRYQACCGWADSSGNEYGIIGSTAGTYIVNVTDPTSPVQSDYIPHRQTDCIWHEYKTYGNYLYVISDDAGNNSLQIIDLSYLPDSAHVIYDDDDIFIHAHTLFVDGNKLYVGIVTDQNSRSSMNVYSLTDPANPVLLRRLDQDYSFIGSVHDMFVSNDTVYASCGYDGLFIFTYDSTANQFFLLGSLQDAVNIYNHSSALSPDHNILYVCEEVPDGQPVKIIDVTDISNPTLLSTFYSHAGATPHNPSVKGQNLIMAYYQDGVYIYDISTPTSPVLSGFFDTYPANPPGVYFVPGYAGCWSTYSDLPSGTLLASDMQSGLFCLDVSQINGMNDVEKNNIHVYPNPATDRIFLDGAGNSIIQIFDLTGKLYLFRKIESNHSIIGVNEFSSGIYFLKCTSGKRVYVKKIIIH